MSEVILTDAATNLVQSVIDAGLGDSTAIVIVPDTNTDTLLGRFIDRAALATLPMQYMTDTPNGLKVYAFGLEQLPPGWDYELTPLTIPDFVNSGRDPFSTLISSLFRVTLRHAQYRNRVAMHA